MPPPTLHRYQNGDVCTRMYYPVSLITDDQIRIWGQVTTKLCFTCEVTMKDPFHFSIVRTSKDGLNSRCKHCLNIRERQRRYNIEDETFKQMMTEQNAMCKICTKSFVALETFSLGENKKETKMRVDYCHKTKKVLGRLYQNCKAGIGFFFNSTRLLQNAIDYLSIDHDYDS